MNVGMNEWFFFFYIYTFVSPKQLFAFCNECTKKINECINVLLFPKFVSNFMIEWMYEGMNECVNVWRNEWLNVGANKGMNRVVPKITHKIEFLNLCCVFFFYK